MTPADWRSPTVAARHARYTDTSGGPDACWPWTGRLNPRGYGILNSGLKDCCHTVKAHRVAWVLEHGSIPDDLTIDHLCYTPVCQNVRHMEVVTLSENVRRRRRYVGPYESYRRGESHPTSILTEDAVRYIRSHYEVRRVTAVDWRCEYRTAAVGFQQSGPPVIRCECGFDELGIATRDATDALSAAPPPAKPDAEDVERTPGFDAATADRVRRWSTKP